MEKNEYVEKYYVYFDNGWKREEVWADSLYRAVQLAEMSFGTFDRVEKALSIDAMSC
jgi:hypothetical protein